MNPSALYPIAMIFWSVFSLYWLVLRLGQKALKRREPWLERLQHLALCSRRSGF